MGVGGCLDGAVTLFGVNRGVDPVLLRGRRPSPLVGVAATVVLVAVCTALVYPIKQLTTVSSLGVVYLLGVVLVSAFWGPWFGVGMSVASAAAFNFFHLRRWGASRSLIVAIGLPWVRSWSWRWRRVR
jgi:hypothetical protein